MQQISCELIEELCRKESDEIILTNIILICVAFRALSASNKTPIEISMTFELQYDYIDSWIKEIDVKGVSYIPTIASGLNDYRYIEWLNNTDVTSPTFWIKEALKKLENSIPKNKSRLFLPFIRSMADDFELDKLSAIFCIDKSIAETWKLIGIEELKKFVDKNL